MICNTCIHTCTYQKPHNKLRLGCIWAASGLLSKGIADTSQPQMIYILNDATYHHSTHISSSLTRIHTYYMDPDRLRHAVDRVLRKGWPKKDQNVKINH